MSKDGVLEELCGYLGSKKDKNTKKICEAQSIQELLVHSKNAIPFWVE